MKKCSKCGKLKNFAKFSKDRSKKDGLRSHCKKCNAEYYATNKERIKVQKAEYCAANKARLKTKNAEYRARPEAKERAREYRASHVSKAVQKRYHDSAKGKASQKRYHDSAKGKASQKRYHDSAKGKVAKKRYHDSAKGKAAQKRYYDSHPEQKRDNRYWWWRQQVLERDNDTCQICRTTKNPHAHHLNSWDVYIDQRYILSNGIALCEDCHIGGFHAKFGRGNNTAEQFAEWLETS